jgi:murein DD-endopeptidase MepM/ murein hydrolase activator NlpD
MAGPSRQATYRRLAVLGLVLCLVALALAGLAGQYVLCGGYPAWQTSDYVLPFPTGTAYVVYQGNCSLGGHHGGYLYSYDFLMPIGSPVTAARPGRVVATLSGFADGNQGIENWVKIQHADGTVAAYSHLHSVLVEIGTEVQAGDPIGLSGNSGQTGGVPHLHFHVSPCLEPSNCGTLAVTFRNTDANPNGLQADHVYAALSLTP